MESQIEPFIPENYLSWMRENYTEAFKDKIVFDTYLRLFSLGLDEIQDVFRQLLQNRSIDTAVGEQLDVIGRIVGQEREIVNAEAFPFFGYEGAESAQSYGDLNSDRVGGYYWDATKPISGNVRLSDDQYRIFIKAKIMKNITRSTPEDVISFIKFVFDVDSVQIMNDFGAGATIVIIGQAISPFVLAILESYKDDPYRSYFVPKTLGVRYDFMINEGTGYFGFQGVPDIKGYGDVNNPSLGGKYSRLI